MANHIEVLVEMHSLVPERPAWVERVADGENHLAPEICIGFALILEERIELQLNVLEAPLVEFRPERLEDTAFPHQVAVWRIWTLVDALRLIPA